MTVQFSIDESLEFNLNLVDGGVPGAQTLSQQLKAIDITKLPYTCVAHSCPRRQSGMHFICVQGLLGIPQCQECSCAASCLRGNIHSM